MPTLQAGSFGAGGIQTSLPGPRGLGSLLPYPGLVPPGGGGVPTVEIKIGIEWGKRRSRKPSSFCCPGVRASSPWRARGRR